MNLPRWLGTLSHLNRLPEVWRCLRTFREPWKLIALYLGLTNPRYPFEVQTRDCVRLNITSYHDAVTAWVIFCREEYGMPASVRTVLDIGANYGAFSLWAGRHARDAHIIALEPFPDCYERLRQHVAINELADRITTWNTALGSASQDRFIAAAPSLGNDAPSQSRPFVGDAQAGPASVMVPALTLGDLVRQACSALGCEEIDFVKMDIEGVEHIAVTPDTVDALKRVRLLSLEYHPNGEKATLFAVIAAAGFRCVADCEASQNSGTARFVREAFGLSPRA